MRRDLAGAVVGASVLALAVPERREWVRGMLGRLARVLGAYGGERVATKLLLKKTAGCLDAAGVPFLLAGGGSCWACGGPFPRDFDLAIRPADTERAGEALRSAGLRIIRRPEDWLFQAYEHGLKIDVLYRPAGYTVDDELFGRAREFEVDGVMMKVLPLEDVFVARLLTLREDTAWKLTRYLASARAVREQVAWNEVEARTAQHPFAHVFLTLLDDLGIIGDGAPPDRTVDRGRPS